MNCYQLEEKKINIKVVIEQFSANDRLSYKSPGDDQYLTIIRRFNEVNKQKVNLVTFAINKANCILFLALKRLLLGCSYI